MKAKENINKGLCKLADLVVADGASILMWGEKEIPDSLRKMYEKEKREENENN